MFGGPGGDPFFGDISRHMQRQMQQMDRIMTGMMTDPFGMGMMGPGMGMITDPNFQQQQQYPNNDPRGQMIDDGRGPRYGQQQMMPQQPPPGMFGGDPFGGMMTPFGGGMFGGGLMGRMMAQAEQAQNDPNSHVYSHSTVISYDGTGEQPRYYESTNSVRKAGDVKEIRKTVRDSSRGEEKMTIGHHMGDRAHIIEKRRERGGDIQEHQELVNVDHDEAEQFDQEWRHRTRQAVLGDRAAPSVQAAIESAPSSSTASSHRHHASSGRRAARSTTNPEEYTGPIIEEVTEDENVGRGDRKRRKGRDGDGESGSKGFIGKLFRA